MSNSSRNLDDIVKDIKESTPISSKTTLSESSEGEVLTSLATALRARLGSPAWIFLTGAGVDTSLGFATLVFCAGLLSPLKPTYAVGF